MGGTGGAGWNSTDPDVAGGDGGTGGNAGAIGEAGLVVRAGTVALGSVGQMVRGPVPAVPKVALRVVPAATAVRWLGGSISVTAVPVVLAVQAARAVGAGTASMV